VLTFETHDHVHEVWIGCIKAKPQKNTEAKKKKMLSDEIKKKIYIYIYIYIYIENSIEIIF